MAEFPAAGEARKAIVIMTYSRRKRGNPLQRWASADRTLTSGGGGGGGGGFCFQCQDLGRMFHNSSPVYALFLKEEIRSRTLIRLLRHSGSAS